MYIRNVGNIEFIDELTDGLGIRNSRDFLTKLSIEFAKKSRNYFNITGDLPYIYREQQLHSIIIPILDNIADAHLAECPTDRTKGSEVSSHGWIDYWVKYGNTIFLIELKHSYHGLSNTSGFRKKSLQEWETANEQLKNIPNHIDFKINPQDNVVKIALQFNTTYTGSKEEHYRSFKNCIDIGIQIKEILANDDLEPNFISNWHVHQDMLIEYEYMNGVERYPYVHMFAKVYTDLSDN